MSIAPGSRIGRYEVRQLLGVGGMGEVYLAFDPDLEREVALKVIREAGAEDSDRIRRFVQEAKAASGLHHPNVAHVYEIGSHDSMRFITMELVRGETLRERIGRGAMPIDEILEVATQVAGALGTAHKAGIVHRDIKPDNVIITPEGYAKVLDFGLAKLREIRSEDAATLVKTQSGVALGTLGYMAPEQLVGGDVSPAADVFSFGVMLYEILARRRPFEGTSATEIATAILTKTPRTPIELRGDVPPRLSSLITKSLAKDPAERYPDGTALHEALRAISREGAAVVRPVRRRVAPALIGVLALVVLVAVGAFAIARAGQSRRAKEAAAQIEEAERFVRERRWVDAHRSASAAALVLPAHERVRELLLLSSEKLTVESDPPGAVVHLQRFQGPPQRERKGVTPLTLRLPRADYLLTLEKPGYATLARPISITPLNPWAEPIQMARRYRMKLSKTESTPPGMHLVEGGRYRLTGQYRPSEKVVLLQDFFIDRYEVSNREFESFIRAGGYGRRDLWKHPFVDKGRTLTFEQAMARLRDTTGLPGPRSWRGGAPPPGRENHPVTDVTWYEAAAYAEWKEKKLPTIYQWEKAARHPALVSVPQWFPWGPLTAGIDATERANFQGRDTMPVDSMPFGASPAGAHHMAGNVWEWCRNPKPPGYAARGGSFSDAVYAFGQTAGFPGFYTSPTLGFRCVSGGGGDEGDFAVSESGFIPVYKAIDDKGFEQIRQRYEYHQDALNARVVERVETKDWTREKILYDVQGKSVPAYLYLPKGFRRPLQVIHYAPAGDVVGGFRTLPESIENLYAPLIRGGRAMFGVVLEGYLGRPRPADWVLPEPDTEEYVEFNIARVTEMRRGLDYLQTRPDIDATRIGLYGMSAGGGTGVYVTALDSRYRSVAFAGTGLFKREEQYAPAVSRIHFVPRIRPPKLMMHGRYDEDASLTSEAEPMFRLLREPKRMHVYEGGHVPPLQVSIPMLMQWFDETMGAPVMQSATP